jgi:hypothetical protein
MAAFTASATATTTPGRTVIVQAVMTDSKVVLVPRKPAGNYISSNGRAATFPRGAVIIFKVTNKGTKPYLPAIGIPKGLDPLGEKYFTAHKVAAPGGHVELLVNFAFRGSFTMLELFHKKPQGKAVPITIT